MGDLLCLLGALMWGSTTVVIKASALRRAPAETTLLYQLAVSAPVLVALSYAFGEPGVFAPTPLVWASVAFQTVVIAWASYLAVVLAGRTPSRNDPARVHVPDAAFRRAGRCSAARRAGRSRSDRIAGADRHRHRAGQPRLTRIDRRQIHRRQISRSPTPHPDSARAVRKPQPRRLGRAGPGAPAGARAARRRGLGAARRGAQACAGACGTRRADEKADARRGSLRRKRGQPAQRAASFTRRRRPARRAAPRPSPAAALPAPRRARPGRLGRDRTYTVFLYSTPPNALPVRRTALRQQLLVPARRLASGGTGRSRTHARLLGAGDHRRMFVRRRGARAPGARAGAVAAHRRRAIHADPGTNALGDDPRLVLLASSRTATATSANSSRCAPAGAQGQLPAAAPTTSRAARRRAGAARATAAPVAVNPARRGARSVARFSCAQLLQGSWPARCLPGRCWIGLRTDAQRGRCGALERTRRRLAAHRRCRWSPAGDVHMHVRSPQEAAGHADRDPPAHAARRSAARTSRPMPSATCAPLDGWRASTRRSCSRETLAMAARCTFSLDELRYEYPEEIVPPGETPTTLAAPRSPSRSAPAAIPTACRRRSRAPSSTNSR